jgi:hypothetical protein
MDLQKKTKSAHRLNNLDENSSSEVRNKFKKKTYSNATHV